MNKNIEILKNKLKEKLNYKRDYSHTIIFEDMKEMGIKISQFIPLKVYRDGKLYSAIHVQSIELDPMYPEVIYFYQYINKIEENGKLTLGLKNTVSESGWSSSISAIKSKMKIKKKEESGEIIAKDNFPKLNPIVVNWVDDLKPNTRSNETTMYKVYWIKDNIDTSFTLKEVLENNYAGRVIINNSKSLQEITEYLVDDEEYEHLDINNNLLIIDFLELLWEDTVAFGELKAYFKSEDKEDTTEDTGSPESTEPQEEKFKNISKISSSTFTKFMDKLLDCEVEIPEDELKFLIKFVMEYYLGDNLKFIINKLTQE